MTTPGAGDISDIVAFIAETFKGITPPADAPKVTYVYEDTTANPSTPCFITAPSDTSIQRTTGTRLYTHTVNAYLLFAAKSLEYASRAQRLWVPVVLDKFDKWLTLNGLCQKQEIVALSYEPVIINEIGYQGITFTFNVWTNASFEFGVNG